MSRKLLRRLMVTLFLWATFIFFIVTFKSSINKGVSSITIPVLPFLNDQESNKEFHFETTYNGVKYSGHTFDKRWNSYLKKFDLLDPTDTNDARVLESTPTFVTAISSNHFHESRTMLTLMMERFEGRKKIYIYDLGLSAKYRNILEKSFGEVIIEIRQFPFEDFPAYVSNLKQYRWKPLIIAQMLSEFPSIWWLDTSSQMLGPVESIYSHFNTCDSSQLHTCPFYPWMTVDNTGHSIFAATNPKMYKYLPLPEEMSKNVTMYGANVQLIYGIRRAKENVLRLWVLCALQEDCMAPEGSSIHCNFNDEHYKEYINCHRFDQSAVNILLTWMNSFNMSRYHFDANNAFGVVRTNQLLSYLYRIFF